METELSAFYDRIARPVMSEPRLDIPKVKTEDVYPRPLPDLFAGTQLVVLGRYTGSGASAVTINGRVRDRDESVVHEADFPDKAMEADFVPKLWATRKVGYLLEQIRLGGENRELVDEVRELGLKFGIITPYTSGLVIENEEMLTRNNGPVPPPMAEPMPDFLGSGRVGGGGAASDGDVAGTKRERAEAAKSVEGFAAVTGAESVDQSRVIQDYKDTKKSVDEIAEIRTVGAKTFVWRDGRYVDTAFTGKEKVLKVRYLSDAYLALAAANPKIASYWKLGQKLVVVTKEGFAVEVGEAGQDTLDAPTIKTFLP
jgi:Ca-activated chloride channel family protein